ncbi:OmpA/MotB family protein [Desulfonatronovibrio hydrogenovorans]|uniref:OmpA/MotB family protein n=1 Tax=Desulfonatronovibrio hydrogenovorans TaxID=53245 RepID=UPI000491421F|nr:OmpA family protein [Desulfonatronovibrio hydrogenovorans]
MNEANLPVQDLEEEDDTRAWVTIFADIALLLLVFFILLFSFSTLSDQKFEETILSVRRSLGQQDTEEWGLRIRTDTAGVLMDQAAQYRQMVESQKRVFSDIRYYQNQKGLEGVVGAHLDAGTITLRLPASALFDLGQVELKPEGKKLLQDLKDVFIRHHDQRINIQGHTDNILPRPGGRFQDNWEISALRALNTLRYLMEIGIDPKRMTATGFADLQPLYPNTTDENRARNRRVEFVLEKHIGG